MLKETVSKALNEQINKELFSAYLYMSMVAYFEDKNLKGFASWMKVQVQEELAHVTKLFDFVNERHGRVILTAIDAPETDWKDFIDVIARKYA